MSAHRGTFIFDPHAGVPAGEWGRCAPGIGLATDADPIWLHDAMGITSRHDGELVIAWDGRLDNREDLLLNINEDRRRPHSDAEIALAAFERRGVEALQSLLGDWSLAIWDARHRIVHLARDYMGARPLCYCTDRRALSWSSDLGELVQRAGRRDALSEAFAAQFMSLRRTPGLTPYDGVRSVPPGSCVSIRAHGSEARHRFWTLQVGDIRYADRRTYEEHLRQLWLVAVGSRLRTSTTVWAEISGGLDSSSVVCMADRLIKQRAAAARGIRLVSHATLQSPEGDERRFIAEIERQVAVESVIVGVEDNQEHRDPARAWITPYALQGVGLAMVRRVLGGGGRIVLSGRLGDAVMGCQPDNSIAVLDDLARGAVLAALRNMRAWGRATRKPFVEIAWNLLDRHEPASDTAVGLLTSALRALIPPAPLADPMKGIRRSKRPLARMVLGYTDGGRLDVPCHPPEIAFTYPFADRRIVDFMMAIPGEELSAPGMTRSLMRRAFACFVPARVIGRQSKGYYPPAAFRAVRRAVASLPPAGELEVVRRGWIDRDALQLAIRTLIDGSGATGADIHCVLRLEAWLLARRASVIPERKEVNSDEVLHA